MVDNCSQDPGEDYSTEIVARDFTLASNVHEILSHERGSDNDWHDHEDYIDDYEWGWERLLE